MQPGALDRERQDARLAFDQRAQQRLDARFGQGEVPVVTLAPRVGGERVAPAAFARAGFQTDLRRDAVARGVDRSGVGDLAGGDDRHLLAQALGMGDHVGREDYRRALCREIADQGLQLALVDRVETGKRLVEDDQPWAVDERAEELDGLRHAFRKLADLLVGGMAEAVTVEQLAPAAAPFGERHAAQRAHEGDRLDRFHRRIEPALLGQVADQPRDVVRIVAAEHAAHALVRVDDPQQHAQRRRLARAIGAENAVDRAFGHGQVDPVDRGGALEPLDQAAGLDRRRPAGPRGIVARRERIA